MANLLCNWGFACLNLSHLILLLPHLPTSLLSGNHLFVLTVMKVKVAHLCPTLCNPIDYIEFSRPEYWSRKPFPAPGDLCNLRIEPRSPTLQADSLPAEPPGKTKNTGVGKPSLFQGIFQTQESNWGILHCRRILYQLSFQGNSLTDIVIIIIIAVGS